MYWCKLIDKKGCVKESFWRDANDPTELMDDLESFEWPKGRWVIVANNEEEEE